MSTIIACFSQAQCSGSNFLQQSQSRLLLQLLFGGRLYPTTLPPQKTFQWILHVCVLVAAFMLASVSSAQVAKYGYDMHGTPVRSLFEHDTRAVVLFFLASDCPISSRYIPEIKRLQSEFAPHGVVFWLVYPNPDETADALRQHLSAYGVQMHTLLDPDHQLVSLVQAKFTPEAAVLAQGRGTALSIRYHGRIDNRYVEIGRERPAATEHDLEQAISAVLANHPPNPPGGPPVGCGIVGQR